MIAEGHKIWVDARSFFVVKYITGKIEFFGIINAYIGVFDIFHLILIL